MWLMLLKHMLPSVTSWYNIANTQVVADLGYFRQNVIRPRLELKPGVFVKHKFDVRRAAENISKASPLIAMPFL